MNQLVPLAPALPLLMAALLAGLAEVAPRWLYEWLAALTAAAVAAICLLLLLRSTQAPLVYWFGGWRPLPGGVALGIAFTVDPFGAALASAVALLTLAAMVFSWRYFETVGSLYHSLLLGFMAAMVAFSLTGDLFDLFVFFELTTVIGFVLAGYKVEEQAPLQGAFNFGITNTIAAFLVLLGIGLVYGRTGALNLAQIGRALDGHPADGLVVVSFVLLTCGYLIKAALVPFHFWLADAHAVAPTPVCILFSGVMVEIGLYAVWRIYWTAYAGALEPHAEVVRAVFVGLGVLTAVVGGVMCFLQHHLKRLLAYSTIAHMGLFMIGLALLTRDSIAGAGVYFLAHAGVKGSLFLCVGILAHRYGSFDEVQLRGRARELPLLAALYVLGGLALAGAPPFGTFLGGEIIAGAAGDPGYLWVDAAFILSGALVGAAVLRTALTVFSGRGRPEFDFYSPQVGEESEPEMGGESATPPTMWLPPVLLLAGGLALGLLPRFATGAEGFAAAFRDHAYYAHWVLGVGGASAPAAAPPTLPGASDLAHALGAVAAALLLAALASYRHRLPDALREAGGRWLGPVFALRTLHSGVVNDYAAWIAAGVAVLGTAFAVGIR